jgi:hypothetical protein
MGSCWLPTSKNHLVVSYLGMVGGQPAVGCLKIFPQPCAPRKVFGVELTLINYAFYLYGVDNLLKRIIEHLHCVPRTEDEVYLALREKPELRLMWFTLPQKQKKVGLARLQSMKFEIMYEQQQDV